MLNLRKINNSLKQVKGSEKIVGKINSTLKELPSPEEIAEMRRIANLERADRRANKIIAKSWADFDLKNIQRSKFKDMDFFNSIRSEFIITCHHLDDCVETWLMSSIHGKPKLIPYKRGSNIFRPFLMTNKKTIKEYALKKQVSWIEDPSNSQTNFMRNHTRLNLIPQALVINPGLRTTIRKKLIETYM